MMMFDEEVNILDIVTAFLVPFVESAHIFGTFALDDRSKEFPDTYILSRPCR